MAIGALSRRTFVALALGAPAAMGCNAFHGYALRYRLRMVFSVDGVERASESVIEVLWRDNRLLFGSSGAGPEFVARVRGEAVVIDLGSSHSYLFALLHENFPIDMVREVLSRGLQDPSSIKNSDQFFRALRLVREEIPLTRSDLPMLVAFGDLAKPKSVYEVKYEDLSSKFGGAVVFVGASVQQTQQKAMTRIRQVLPWIDSVYGTRLDGKVTNTVEDRKVFANLLHQGDFVRGGK